MSIFLTMVGEARYFNSFHGHNKQLSLCFSYFSICCFWMYSIQLRKVRQLYRQIQSDCCLNCGFRFTTFVSVWLPCVQIPVSVFFFLSFCCRLCLFHWVNIIIFSPLTASIVAAENLRVEETGSTPAGSAGGGSQLLQYCHVHPIFNVWETFALLSPRSRLQQCPTWMSFRDRYAIVAEFQTNAGVINEM